MIKRRTIYRVLSMISFIYPDSDCTLLEAQLMKSLGVYALRDEFDGSFESAVECLTMAGYEIEGI